MSESALDALRVIKVLDVVEQGAAELILVLQRSVGWIQASSRFKVAKKASAAALS